MKTIAPCFYLTADSTEWLQEKHYVLISVNITNLSMHYVRINCVCTNLNSITSSTYRHIYISVTHTAFTCVCETLLTSDPWTQSHVWPTYCSMCRDLFLRSFIPVWNWIWVILSTLCFIFIRPVFSPVMDDGGVSIGKEAKHWAIVFMTCPSC